MVELLVAYDKTLYYFVQNNLRNPLLDWLMPVISEPLAWGPPVALFFLYALHKHRKQGVLLMFSALLLMALSDGSATSLKGLFLRPRPRNPEVNIARLVERPARSSFPSNHAANSFALATLVTVYYPPGAAVAFGAAGLVAFSRVYLRDHYPLDVLSGAMLGIVLALAVALATRSLRQQLADVPGG